MPTDPVIEFAQQRFGPGEPDAAIGPELAPILPGWLRGSFLGRNAAGEDRTLVLDRDDGIGLEGDAADPSDVEPVSDGTTAHDLAFYVPFHFHKTQWGIYIRAAGVLGLSRRIAPSRLHVTALKAARAVLVEHEQFHFIAEYAASRVEILTAESRYRECFKCPEASEHEEAMANGRALRALRRHRPVFTARVIAWMQSQPPGYRDFQVWMPPRTRQGERKAAAFITIVATLLNKLNGSHQPGEFLFRHPPLRRVPTYWVQDVALPSVRLFRPFPKDFGLQVFVHSNDHKPPHIHVQAPPGRDRTRYRWPQLTPLKGDPVLRARERRNLDYYIAVHGPAIEARIRSIPWQ